MGIVWELYGNLNFNRILFMTQRLLRTGIIFYRLVSRTHLLCLHVFTETKVPEFLRIR